ncbi:unnamed protein product [Gadus morhua 'NCC']
MLRFLFAWVLRNTQFENRGKAGFGLVPARASPAWKAISYARRVRGSDDGRSPGLSPLEAWAAADGRSRRKLRRSQHPAGGRGGRRACPLLCQGVQAPFERASAQDRVLLAYQLKHGIHHNKHLTYLMHGWACPRVSRGLPLLRLCRFLASTLDPFLASAALPWPGGGPTLLSIEGNRISSTERS